MDALSKTFAALADPTRRAILEQLTAGGASFTDLARPHQMSRPAVVKHIKALERAGLVRRTGPAARPVYLLNPDTIRMTRDWLNRYERHWEQSMDRLGAYVATGDTVGGDPEG